MYSQPTLQPLKSSQIHADVEITGWGMALPAHQWSQNQILRFIESKFSLKPQSKALYRKILRNPSILSRSFSLSNLDEILHQNLDAVNERFEKAATKLATRALLKALDSTGIHPVNLDYIVVGTCTGYLCPGLSTALVETCGLRRDIHNADLTGMGCGAGLPALEQATNFLKAHPGATAAVVNVEICSAAFYSDDNPEIIISNSIFGDGAAALILKSRASLGSNGSKNGSLHPKLVDFQSLIIPEWRESLRFRTENGYLKNVLSKEVPQQSTQAIHELTQKILSKNHLDKDEITHWIVHAGGKKILDGIQTALDLPPKALQSARNILKNHGNMSSPTVFFVMENQFTLQPPKAGDKALLASFGAGFSAYAVLMEF